MIKILFRCDGGPIPEIGTGHVFRCLLIAEKLSKNKQIEIAFIMRNYKESIQLVKSRKFKVYTFNIEDDEIKATLDVIEKFLPDILIIDKLNNDENYLHKIKTKKQLVLITLDDNKHGINYADIKINAILTSKFKKRVTNLFQGFDYITIPEYSSKPKAIRKKGKKIFVSFGGYDHLNLTLKTLESLENIPASVQILVVVGTSYKYKEQLDEFIRKSKRKYYIYYQPKKFKEILNSADIAVVSGGLTLFHALSIGIPSVVINQYKHQMNTASKLSEKNAIINLGLGENVTKKTIFNTVNHLLQNYKLRSALSDASKKIVDKKGLERVSELILMVKELPWDTNFFGIKIARLLVPNLTEDILYYTLKYCKLRNIKCLYFLCEIDDINTINLAKKHDFICVGVNLTFRHDLKNIPMCSNPRNITIRESKNDDIPYLKNMTKNMYIFSRFYSDPHFSKKTCDRLYETWVENSCHGFADKVFVAEYKKKIVGYVTCHIDQKENFGRIGLIGVANRAQRKKIGTNLLNNALRWFKIQNVRYVLVSTQDKNIQAQKLYKKCKFKILKKELWFHKWFE